jgi:hypothetical protein
MGAGVGRGHGAYGVSVWVYAEVLFVLTGTFSRRWPVTTSDTTGEREGHLTEGPVAQGVLEANEASCHK